MSDRSSTGMFGLTYSSPHSMGRRFDKVIHYIPISRTGQINLKVTKILKFSENYLTTYILAFYIENKLNNYSFISM